MEKKIEVTTIIAQNNKVEGFIYKENEEDKAYMNVLMSLHGVEIINSNENGDPVPCDYCKEDDYTNSCRSCYMKQSQLWAIFNDQPVNLCAYNCQNRENPGCFKRYVSWLKEQIDDGSIYKM